MDKFRFSVLALALAAVFPAASLADEESNGLEGLDETMIVLDTTFDLEYSASEVGGPDGNDGDWSDNDTSDEQFKDELASKIEAASEDEMKEQFEGDDFFRDEDKMNEEYDFDDRDDIDVDEFSEESDDSVD